MAFFLEQIRTVLPVLGFDFLRDSTRPTSQPKVQPATPQESPYFVLEVPKYQIKARAQEVDGEFFVLQGSLAREEWVGTDRGYKTLFNQLLEDRILTPTESGLTTFTTDQAFSSPSAAAAVISGRSANGRTQWTVEGSGKTYGNWQDEQVSASTEQD